MVALGGEALFPPPPLSETPLLPVYAAIVSARESYAVETMRKADSFQLLDLHYLRLFHYELI